MGRTRTVSDDTILDAAAGLISDVGPGGFTLAAVARAAELAAPTLVQRFGSKRGLLLALSSRAPAEPPVRFAAARMQHGSPLAALRAGLLGMASGIATPQELANHLAFLQLELIDPEFHQYALRHAESMIHEVRSILAEAVGAGELRACDVDELARALYTSYNGALLSWSILRRGSLTAYLDRELTRRLEPYRPAGTTPRAEPS